MKITKTLTFALVAIAGFTFACGGGEKTTETTADTPTVSAPAPAPEMSLEEKHQDDPVYIKGLAKLKESDCTSCHNVERKIVGPAYKDVAAKYENTEENVTMLAGKVINGTVGTWGEIPMAPHPALSEEDAKDMVRYVLLLR